MHLPTRLASAALLALAPLLASAQLACTPLLQGLKSPGGLAVTPRGDVLISETGTVSELRGRLSLMSAEGLRRTLLDGLPAGIADVGDASGPAGLALRGRTLYMAIGVGDVGILGGGPGTSLPNPAGPSSPLFSSVLALHFSADVEASSGGFALQPGDDARLAAGERLLLRNAAGERMTVRRVADFPNYAVVPLPQLPGNIQSSNPYQLALLDDALFASDGGRNLVWRVGLEDGSLSVLAAFPNIPNPLFGMVGGPFQQAVPTGLAIADGQLLVALFRGAPFAPGSSTVQWVNPADGSNAPLISGLKTAIAVSPLGERQGGGLLVMQHASVGPFFGGPGLLLRYATPAGPAQTLASCMTRPTALAVDAKRGRVYISQLDGQLVAVDLPQ